ncbi:uncharacterized protein [Mytilus edulis]|uniref:uncharacterized protein n=1 Tax=Mytilus edulis TaxID=6550 RepID=UPI0039F0F3B0
MQAEAILNYEFQNYRFQSTYSMMSFYHDNPEHLQKLINEQGHLLEKDGVNILTEQESSVEQEKILVIEPRPKSASTSVGKKCTDQEVPSTSKAAEEENGMCFFLTCICRLNRMEGKTVNVGIYSKDKKYIMYIIKASLFVYNRKPKDEKHILKRYLRRTPKPANKLDKPICRTKSVKYVAIHHNKLKKGRSKDADVSELRMNHYWGARLQNWGDDTATIFNITMFDDSIVDTANQLERHDTN